MAKYKWQFYLKDNPLTKDNPNDCTAEVNVTDSMRNGDIAQEIIDEGSEIKYDTLVYIFGERDRIVFNCLKSGKSVINRYYQLFPRITGAFASNDAVFDAKVNKLMIDMILTSVARKELDLITVESLGPKRDTAYISLVTDTLTDKTDGSITPNDDIRVEGSRIKIAGNASEIGVFFVPIDGKDPVKVTRKLTQNDPSQLLARVPALADGQYTLRIVTQFSMGQQFLKEPRTLEYKTLLTVGSPDSGDDDRPVIE